MLTKPSDKELKALARVSRSDDGQILKEYLLRALDDVREKVMTAETDVLIRRLQGRGEALKDFREALEMAPDLVVKLENRAQGR